MTEFATSIVEAAVAELIVRIEEEPGRPLEEFLTDLDPALRSVVKRRIDILRGESLLQRPPAVAQGTVLAGRFEVRDEVGRGGMGLVLRAWDQELEREVALKLLLRFKPRSPRMERFLQEARVCARLNHPNILSIHEVLELSSGEPMLVLPLIKGRTLRHLLFSQPQAMSVRRRVEIVVQVARAVEYAHSRGVLHRDVKPSNVMVGNHGEVVLMDWGLARMSDALGDDETDSSSPSPSSVHTQTGDSLGTPGYMAPEQARGDSAVIDERTDVYGLGALLHATVSGRDRSHRSGSPTDDLPSALAAVCYRCFRENPDERYQGAAELARDLQAWLDDRQGVAWTDDAVVRIAKLVRRRPGAATGVMVTVVTVLFATVLVQQFRAAQGVRTQLAEQVQSEIDEGNIDRFRRLVEGRVGPMPSGNETERNLVYARQVYEGFRDYGLDLASAQADDILAHIAEVDTRCPVLADQIELGLHQAAHYLVLVRAPLVGKEAFAMDPWVRWLEREEPWTSRACASSIEVLDRLNRDPWRQALWERLRSLWFEARPELRPLDLEAFLAEGGTGNLVLALRLRAAELQRVAGLDATTIRARQIEALQAATLSDRSSYTAFRQLSLLVGLALRDHKGVARLPLAIRRLAAAEAAMALRPDSYQALHERGLALSALSDALKRVPVAGNEEPHLSTFLAELENDLEDCLRLCVDLEPCAPGAISSLATQLANDSPHEARDLHARAYELDPTVYSTTRNFVHFLWDHEPGSPLHVQLLENEVTRWPHKWSGYNDTLGLTVQQGRLEDAAALVRDWIEVIPALPTRDGWRERHYGPVLDRLERIEAHLDSAAVLDQGDWYDLLSSVL